MSSDPNRREFTRVPSGLDVDIRFDDGSGITGRIQDVSLRGLFLATDRTFAKGTKCRVMLHLGGRGHGIVLEASGMVARRTDEGLAVRFDEISYEAFEHLRNLVRFNADDPDTIEDEVDSKLGLKENEGESR